MTTTITITLYTFPSLLSFIKFPSGMFEIMGVLKGGGPWGLNPLPIDITLILKNHDKITI